LSLEQSEVNTVGNIKPINQETPQNSRKTKKNSDSKENDLIMQKALHILNEKEDQYDVFGKYVATELRNLSSEYLRKKLKRKFQKAILEISEEDERLNSISSVSSNLSSVGSHGHTDLFHTDLSNHSVQFSKQPLSQTVADYLHTETESTYVNL